jgi:hypothetical protein
MSEPRGEKTHRDTVRGLPGTGPPPEEGSPPELDARILAAARRAVEEHPRPGLTDRLLPLSGSGRPLLVGFTVGLIVGLLLHGAWRAPPRPLATPAGAPTPLLAPDGAPDPDVLAAPERWLESIATLVRAGRLDDAQAEIAAFRRRYPAN